MAERLKASSIYLSDDEWARLKLLADLDGRGVSTYIRRMIAALLPQMEVRAGIRPEE